MRINVKLMKQLFRRRHGQIAGTLPRRRDMAGRNPRLGVDELHVPARILRLKLGIRLDALGKVDGYWSNRCVFHWQLVLGPGLKLWRVVHAPARSQLGQEPWYEENGWQRRQRVPAAGSQPRSNKSKRPA